MKSIFQYFFFLIFLSVVSIRADYSYSPDSCVLAGVGRKSCDGYGTSPVADLFGYTFQDKTQYLIVGSCEGLYFLWGIYYKWQQGAQAITRAETLYAYILQIPKMKCSNSTREYIYLVILVASCPRVFELTPCTKGDVPSTDLPWPAVYQVVSEYCNTTYLTDCELIQGSSTIYSDNTDFVWPQRVLVSNYLEGLNGFKYIPLGGRKDDEAPKYIAKKYNLDVHQAKSDPGLYVQGGNPDGPQYACKDPSGEPGIGRQLANQNFNVNSVYKRGGLCSLVKRIAKLFAASKTSFIFGYISFTILQKPYHYCYQFASLCTRLPDYGVYQTLFSLC